MSVSIKNAVCAAGSSGQRYDLVCKEVLSYRQILAFIMKETVREYQNCSMEEIEKRWIEPESICLEEPVGRDSARIHGVRNEDSTISEGTVLFDVLFRAKYPDKTGGKIGLRINIEAQEDYRPGYPISARAMFYCARELSSQPDHLFEGMNYGKLEKVYSIWICTGGRIPEREQFSTSLYRTVKYDIMGKTDEQELGYDLMNSVIIRLGKDDGAGTNRLFEMLQALFSRHMDIDQRISRLERLGIRMEETLKKEVEAMCNLSQGIWREGIETGIEEGFAQGEKNKAYKAAGNMFARGFSAEETAGIVEEDISVVRSWYQEWKRG